MSHTRIIHVSYTIMNNSLKRDMDELCHVSHTNNCIWDMNDSCVICKWAETWMNWVMSHTRIIVCETNNSCLIYKWATSHTWTSHVTHTQTWALAKLCLYFELSHFSHTNHSCLTCKWATSHTWTSQVPHMNKPSPTHEQAMSHTWTSHVPHMNKSSPTSTGMSGGKISKHVAFDQQVNKNNSFFSKISFKSKM